MFIAKNKFVKKASSQRGVALLLSIFILALASIVIVNLSYSTMISSQQNANTLRVTQAEYLLKSLETLSIILLKNDTVTSYDGKNCDITELKNPASCFLTAKDVSGFIDIPLNGVSLQMQLTPANAYLNFTNLGGTTTNIKRPELILSLFKNLDLENIEGEETSSIDANSGENSNEQLVANIIDFMDTDNTNFIPNGKLTAQGIEASISDKEIKKYWKAGNQISNLSTLYNIPGFNMNQVRQLAPYFVLYEGNTTTNLNINFVDSTILNAISDLASEYGGSIDVEGIIEKQAEDPPFQNASEISSFITEPTDNSFIATLLGNSVKSDIWELTAKVTIGNTTAFSRSIIKKNGQSEARVISREYLF